MKHLAATLHAAWKRGAGIVLTVPDNKDINLWFSWWLERVDLPRHTNVAASKEKRGALNQVMWMSPNGAKA